MVVVVAAGTIPPLVTLTAPIVCVEGPGAFLDTASTGGLALVELFWEMVVVDKPQRAEAGVEEEWALGEQASGEQLSDERTMVL